MKWLHLHWVDTNPQGVSPHSPINDKKTLTLVKNQNYWNSNKDSKLSRLKYHNC